MSKIKVLYISSHDLPTGATTALVNLLDGLLAAGEIDPVIVFPKSAGKISAMLENQWGGGRLDAFI